MARRGRRYMMIGLNLLICLMIAPGALAKKPSEKEQLVQTLVNTCEKSLKTQMAFDKYKKVCRCFKKEMNELTIDELRHLVLADKGESNQSDFPVDQGIHLENYKLEVAYQCMGQSTPEAIKPGKSDSSDKPSKD